MNVAGEWWKADTEVIINQAMQSGGAPNISDAYTMNGLPGPLYNCSSKGMDFISSLSVRMKTLEQRLTGDMMHILCIVVRIF